MTERELAKKILELYVEKFGETQYGPYVGSAYHSESDNFGAIVYDLPLVGPHPSICITEGYNTVHEALSALLDKVLAETPNTSV